MARLFFLLAVSVHCSSKANAGRRHVVFTELHRKAPWALPMLQSSGEESRSETGRMSLASVLLAASANTNDLRFLRRQPVLAKAASRLRLSRPNMKEDYFNCPNCQACYVVPDEVKSHADYAGSGALKVRCASCGHSFGLKQEDVITLDDDSDLIDFPEMLKQRMKAGQSVSNYSVFLANIPYSVDTTEKFQEAFEETFGKGVAHDFFLLRDRESQRPTGSGLATFDRWYDGVRAIEMAKNKQCWMSGRQLIIREKTPKPKSAAARTKSRNPNKPNRWSHAEGKPLEEARLADLVKGRVTNVKGENVWADVGFTRNGHFKAAPGTFRVGDEIEECKVVAVDPVNKRLELELTRR